MNKVEKGRLGLGMMGVCLGVNRTHQVPLLLWLGKIGCCLIPGFDLVTGLAMQTCVLEDPGISVFALHRTTKGVSMGCERETDPPLATIPKP